MAVDFLLDPATFAIPTMGTLRQAWQHIPNDRIRDAIAQEHQYLQFHQYLLESLRYTKCGHAADPPYKNQVNYTVRAGAIKAAILLAGSIAEAALRAHAEKRGYSLHNNLRKRTFGNVLAAWKSGGNPRSDVNAIWPDLETLQDTRNNIHLFKAANDAKAKYSQVLADEAVFFGKVATIMNALQQLQSP